MAFFKNAQSWISKDKDGREQLSDQLSGTAPEAVRKERERLSEEVSQSVQEGVRGMSWKIKAARNASETVRDPVQNDVRGHVRTAKAAKNLARTDPVSVSRIVGPLSGVVGSVVMIGSGQPWTDVLFLFVITVMLIIICNPWDLISRFLAIQTRAILALDISLVTFTVIRMDPYPIAAAIAWTILTVPVMALMNNRWLMSYNMLYSDAVMHALVQAPDNAGVIAWQQSGKRECRKALAESGLPFDDNVLELFCQIIYIIGYYAAFISTSKDIKAREKAELQLSEIKRDLSEAENQIWHLQNQLEAEKAATEKLKSNQAASDAVEIFWKKKAEELQAQIDLMENEYMMDADQSEVKEVATDQREDLSQEDVIRNKIMLLKQQINPETGRPISIRKMTEILNRQGYKISKTKVADIGKQLNEEHEDKEAM